jgi:hypothetical protein
MLAADYPFLDVMWTMLVFFLWVIWFWILILIISDLFRRHDTSGLGKAVWVVVLIILPFLGTLIYLITQGQAMAERRASEAKAAQTDFDSYVRSVAAEKSPSAEIEKAKQLLDSGAITQEEFDALKKRALASA